MKLPVALVLLASCRSASATAPPSPLSPPAPPAIAGSVLVAPPEPAEASLDDAPLPTYVPGPSPSPTPTPTPDASERPEPNPPRPSAEDERACAARGGKIEPVCMLGNFECVLRYRDGGKRCTSKSDCTGQCLYRGPEPAPPNPVGACERTSDPCGCKAPIVRGRAQPMLCAD